MSTAHERSSPHFDRGALLGIPLLLIALAILGWTGLPWVLVAVIGLAAGGFVIGRSRAVALSDGRYADLHSLPVYHGWYVALWVAGPAIFLWIVLSVAQGPLLNGYLTAGLEDRMKSEGVLVEQAELTPALRSFYIQEMQRHAAGTPLVTETVERVGLLTGTADRSGFIRLAKDDGDALGDLQFIYNGLRIALPLALAAFLFTRSSRDLALRFRARNNVEHWVIYALVGAATISIMTTLGIFFSVVIETLLFFEKVPWHQFLFGTQWSPQIAIREDQVGSTGAFGAVPLFAGTMLISAVAMLVAGPIGLFSAIYLSEFATPRFRKWAKPVMEILAGVPTVVYGFFAALTVAPAVRNLGQALGLDVASESALAAGAVMGIMIIPFVSSLSDDAISSVPRSLRDASLALGATRAETVMGVLLPAALPGIVAGFLLAVSRAIGETMIVVMAAGLAANLTANPLEAVTTVTVQIVTLLVGDQEFDSAKTLSAFALGFVLFITTLMLNVIALYVMQRFREKYD